MKAPRARAGAREPGGARTAVRRLLWLVGGVAVMAGAGYLLAALVLFPAPLLPNERAVPRLLGESFATAQAELRRQGLDLEVTGREGHPSAPAGSVVWQDPPPGVAVPRGDTVSIAVSTGPLLATVPDVRGLDPDLARRLLLAAGLRVELLDTLPGSQQPAGIALGTTPAAWDSVRTGGSVVLHLSKGKR